MKHPALALATTLTALLGCQSESGRASDGAPRVALAAPIRDGDPVALATRIQLPERAPQEEPGLHNLYQLSERIYSGSEPDGDAAFARLAALGVKTVLSVDGKQPEAELAAGHGLRYVHVPIKYSGIGRTELLQIAKTFRELPGPFYVHCFHGKHRGPAGAAVGRLVLDGASREQVLAEMRQWCGTSQKYDGLYKTIAQVDLPTDSDTAAYDWDFPATHPLGGFRQAMIVAPRAHDNLKALATHGFDADPDHPDLDAGNEAAKLHETFAQGAELDECRGAPADWQGWLSDIVAQTAELQDAIAAIPAEGDAARARAAALVDSVGELCASCHRVYRNRHP